MVWLIVSPAESVPESVIVMPLRTGSVDSSAAWRRRHTQSPPAARLPVAVPLTANVNGLVTDVSFR